MKLIQLAITYVFYTQISVKQSFHKHLLHYLSYMCMCTVHEYIGLDQMHTGDK